ncbi:hypothetical protein D8674_020427 [Pyrus ussuriensis x Pyrus communis]|uniref:Uncharacterized protein n=1 Tax=Pyrus ussuriensis x Pyrus communis TaxID=2448454 RepID=A0A5N5HFM0_9ROSA|nr:hypothetical protein D8674_020427 [Pyrus ussuriensis x Pyrus communis]
MPTSPPPPHKNPPLPALPCNLTDLKACSNLKPKYCSHKTKTYEHEGEEKSLRGCRSEAAAVEDYVREKQNLEIVEKKDEVMKRKVDDGEEEEEDEGFGGEKSMVVEEGSKDWPLDADVGWGIQASLYFENHPIRNMVGDNGVEIDWEGEVEDNWVKEINYLEWESFAFHPSPLLVLVFERYNRASRNWKALKELKKAVKVYWNAKDRLPPRLCSSESTDLQGFHIRCCGSRFLVRETGIFWGGGGCSMWQTKKERGWGTKKEMGPTWLTI